MKNWGLIALAVSIVTVFVFVFYQAYVDGQRLDARLAARTDCERLYYERGEWIYRCPEGLRTASELRTGRTFR